MKNSLLVAAAGVAWALAAWVPVAAQAQEACPQDCPCAYLRDSEGKHVKNSFDECWQTSTWAPPCRSVECGCVVAAVERVTEKLSLETDALFDFDQATLKPNAREKLDEVVARAKGFEDIESISIRAYADPIGSDAYNERLSQNRANAVKRFLVDQGIPAGQVSAEGMGETNQFAECEGVRGRPALIQCYQPNRRADVEIIGTKVGQ